MPRRNTTAATARLQHAAENTSDYLEVIADLLTAGGEARLTDIASRLGVTMATASRKVAQLQRDGLVRSQPYRSVFLEPEGAKLAEESKTRHNIVLDFLLAAGVPRKDAEHDAEGIEHHVSPATLDAMRCLTDLLHAVRAEPAGKGPRKR